MRFQSGPCNPTEALIGMQLLYLTTAIYPSIWSSEKSTIILMVIIFTPFFSAVFLNFIIKKNYTYHELI
jgi:hypothetical protein